MDIRPSTLLCIAGVGLFSAAVTASLITGKFWIWGVALLVLWSWIFLREYCRGF